MEGGVIQPDAQPLSRLRAARGAVCLREERVKELFDTPENIASR